LEQRAQEILHHGADKWDFLVLKIHWQKATELARPIIQFRCWNSSGMLKKYADSQGSGHCYVSLERQTTQDKTARLGLLKARSRADKLPDPKYKCVMFPVLSRIRSNQHIWASSATIISKGYTQRIFLVLKSPRRMKGEGGKCDMTAKGSAADIDVAGGRLVLHWVGRLGRFILTALTWSADGSLSPSCQNKVIYTEPVNQQKSPCYPRLKPSTTSVMT
jgi:hypothetical protein